jgi:DNA-binding transcriptional LysR family regulator
MELYQIRYFLALCETLNFARAAERCGVCQPSLTRGVQKLEQELGGLLIRRERRLTHLTHLGELVRPMLEEVVCRVETAKSAAQRFLISRDRPLSLGTMPSIGLRRIAPVLARFGAQHPDIEMTVVEGDKPDLEKRLLDATLELAVATRLAPINGRLRQHMLYRERVVVVFPVGHRFAELDTIPLLDLRDENFLLRANCEKRALLHEACRNRGFELRVVYRSAREDWIQTMVAAGRGVTLMPECVHLGNGTLARPLVEPALTREVALLTVAGRRQDPAVHRLVRAFQAHRWSAEPALVEGAAQ